jgi:hypothetical protein
MLQRTPVLKQLPRAATPEQLAPKPARRMWYDERGSEKEWTNSRNPNLWTSHDAEEVDV